MAEGGPSRKRPPGLRASLAVEIVRHEAGWTRAKITDAHLKRAARAGFSAGSPLRGDGRITLLLANDAEMRALNRTWRGKDAATNVLSFPADAIMDRGFLGDIVLAYETTLNEAKEQGIPLMDHASHLVIHGVLHLLGFDHAEETEAERMERVERIALAAIGIADPYAPRRDARHAEALP
jgi:probable rRNA maturation factor